MDEEQCGISALLPGNVSPDDFYALTPEALDSLLKVHVPNVRNKAKLRKLYQDASGALNVEFGPLPLTSSFDADRTQLKGQTTNVQLEETWNARNSNKPFTSATPPARSVNLDVNYLPSFAGDSPANLNDLTPSFASQGQTSKISESLKAIANEHPDWKDDVQGLQELLAPVAEMLRAHNLGNADSVIHSVFMGSVFASIQKLFNSDNGVALSDAHQQTAENVGRAAQFRERAQEARAEARIEDAIAFEKGQTGSLEKALITYHQLFDLIQDGQESLELPRQPLAKLTEQQQAHATSRRACESELRSLQTLRKSALEGYSKQQMQYSSAKADFANYLARDGAVRRDLSERLAQILKEESEREQRYLEQVERFQTVLATHQQETAAVSGWEREWAKRHSALVEARRLHSAGIQVYEKALDFAQSAFNRVEERFQKRVQEFKQNTQTLEKSFSEAYSQWYLQLRLDLYRTTKALEELRTEVATLQYEIAKAGRRNLVQDVQAKTQQLEARSDQVMKLVAEQAELQEKLARDEDFARNVIDRARLPFPDDLVDGIIREEEVRDLEADQAHLMRLTMEPQRIGGELQAAKMIVMEEVKADKKMIRFDAELDDTAKQKVPANSYFEVEKSGQKGARVTWKFQTLRKEVDFQVVFRSAQGLGEEEVEPRTRLQGAEGCYEFKAKGALILKWDNSFSHYESKEIIYTVTKEAAKRREEVEEEEQERGGEEQQGSRRREGGRVFRVTD